MEEKKKKGLDCRYVFEQKKNKEGKMGENINKIKNKILCLYHWILFFGTKYETNIYAYIKYIYLCDENRLINKTETNDDQKNLKKNKHNKKK